MPRSCQRKLCAPFDKEPGPHFGRGRAKTVLGQLLILCVIMASPALADTPEIAHWANPGACEVTVVEFPALTDPRRAGRKVPCKVHLPVIDHAAPVIVVSHGGGGHWDANYAQARHLATHGFVVVCVEHVGSNTQVLKQSWQLTRNLERMTHDAQEVLGRPKDIGFALDQIETWNQTDATLKGKFDLERVGMLGHSFGAYTTLVVCGARPALQWLTPRVAPGRGLGPDLRDSRVDCGVALSPQGPGEPFFLPESYRTLATPLLGISGSKDRAAESVPENRRQAFKLWPAHSKQFIWLENADHTAFSDSTGSDHRMLPSATRADAQPLVRAATVLYFKQHLQGDEAAGKLLTEAHLRSYLQGKITSLQVLNK